jgi:tripartite-type tricarboxylate transporter receptor subunit TctC
LFLAVASFAAVAQSYPVKPVRIIVPFAPGGGTDFIARFMAQRLSANLGQQFVVENRAGAGSTIGTEAGLKSPPDGYTLTIVSNSYAANASLYKLRFDPIADMTPVIQISSGPYMVVVHPSLPVKNLRELVALAKAEPGRVFFASSGQGSINHLATELLASMAGFKLNHVPYKGTGPALADTLGGQTNATLGSTASTLPHVRAGRLRALAVTTTSRMASEPEIPTVAEAGVPGYETVLWARTDRAEGIAGAGGRAPERRGVEGPSSSRRRRSSCRTTVSRPRAAHRTNSSSRSRRRSSCGAAW